MKECDHPDELDGVMVFSSPSYREALIGVSEDERAVYDYDLMVQSLVDEDGMTEDETAEWIAYNAILALPYMGEKAPIVMYRLTE